MKSYERFHLTKKCVYIVISTYIMYLPAYIGIVTRHFFYKKTFMIKVIQNFMEITLCFNCFSEKTCWKMLFNILFSVSIFDTMFLFWFIGGCCLVAIAWSRIRLWMSTKKSQNWNLKNFFQQVLLEYVFIWKVISIKFWITFILTVFI